MKSKDLWERILSCVLIAALMFAPLQSMSQSLKGQKNLLQSGTQMVLRLNENFNGADKTESGTITAKVETDVYSSDGSQVIIKAGTPANIDYSIAPNGSWGKAGKVCFTNAYTNTIDNKQVPLSLSTCEKGGSKLGGVIVLSVLFFPVGLFSGFMKGSMPKIQQGATFTATVMQNVAVD